MNNDLKNTEMNRRNFLIRSAKAGASVAAACSVGYWFYDPTVPELSSDKHAEVSLPDFSIAGQKGKMSVAIGSDRVKTIHLALKALGGIETFVKKGDRVMLKVNAAFASPPLLSATSHPGLVGEVARLCFKAGASKVTVTDNPINDPASCFMLTGIDRAAKSAGAGVAMPRNDFFKPQTVPGRKIDKNWPPALRTL